MINIDDSYCKVLNSFLVVVDDGSAQGNRSRNHRIASVVDTSLVAVDDTVVAAVAAV